MELKLNDILHLTEEEINNSKIELNMKGGSGLKRPFIDLWLRYTDEEKVRGDKEEISFWGHTKNQKIYQEGNFGFAFIRLNNEDEWLFISAAEITGVPEYEGRAKFKVLNEFSPLFGRLIIKLKKGNKFGRWLFNLSTFINEAVVKEILPCVYSGEKFEGYDKVNLPYSRLDDIFQGRILPTYYEALQNITGVYCLTDTNTGKLYIGSATGEGGVAQRWGSYLDTKHGGNVELRKLRHRHGDEYFEQYFTFTLLEYFSLSYDPDKIKEREQYWKKCFDTINNGYNDN